MEKQIKPAPAPVVPMRKFRIKHDTFNWECQIVIEPEKALVLIKEQIEFWSGWEHCLAMNDGDYIITFVKELGREILSEILGGIRSGNVQALQRRFTQKEGWYPLDGSAAVTLVKCDSYELDSGDIEFTEVKP